MFNSEKSHIYFNEGRIPSKNGAVVILKTQVREQKVEIKKFLAGMFMAFSLVLMSFQTAWVYNAKAEGNPVTSPITSEESASPSATPSVTPSGTPITYPEGSPSASPSATPSSTPITAPEAPTPSSTPITAPEQPSAPPSPTPSATPITYPESSPSASPSASVSPQLVVTYPNGGEVFVNAQIVNIIWNTVGLSNYSIYLVDILYPQYPAWIATIYDYVQETVTQKSYSWTIANLPGEYKIRIASYGLLGGASISDDSDNSFTILEATPSASPSESPSASPSAEPSVSPSPSPSAEPSTEPSPSASPSAEPSESPSPSPSASPSEEPSASPSPSASATPSEEPSASPSPSIEPEPSASASASASPSTPPSGNNPTNGGGTPSNGGGGGSSSGGSVGAPSCNNEAPKSAPIIVSAVTTGPNEVTLTWDKAKDPVTHYVIAYGLEKGKPLYGNPNVGNVSSYTVKGLSGGVTYYFKVRAGNDCMPGAYSEEIAVKVGGKFIKGPAQNFQPGVLGKSTKNNQIESPAPSVASSFAPKINLSNGGLLGKIFNFFKGFFKP